jgi:hypothetical protein
MRYELYTKWKLVILILIGENVVYCLLTVDESKKNLLQYLCICNGKDNVGEL